jgi:hypothetical protein
MGFFSVLPVLPKRALDVCVAALRTLDAFFIVLSSLCFFVKERFDSFVNGVDLSDVPLLSQAGAKKPTKFGNPTDLTLFL